MTKRAQKGHETRPVSFRMPVDVYNELASVAETRGVDLSAMLNWIVAEYRPVLLKKRAEHEAKMLETAIDLRNVLASPGGTDKALGLLREVLKELQDVYAEVAKRAIDEKAQRAA